MAKRKTVTSTVTIPNDVTHAQAFALLKAEIDAVSDEDLLTISTDITYLAETAFVAAGRIESLMPELAKLPPEHFDLEQVRKLRLYAGALIYTHVLTMAPKPDARLPALLEEAVVVKRKLLAVAEALAQLGYVSSELVAAIRSGQGHHDTANDLTALAEIFCEIWARLGHRLPIDRALVDRGAVLGTQLIAALGDRRLGADALDPPDDARRTRARAYTAFMNAYDTCRQGVTLLRWKHGDIDRYVPSIYPRRTRRPVLELADEPSLEPEPPALLPIEPAVRLVSG
jgi:hypothetical protein